MRALLGLAAVALATNLGKLGGSSDKLYRMAVRIQTEANGPFRKQTQLTMANSAMNDAYKAILLARKYVDEGPLSRRAAEQWFLTAIRFLGEAQGLLMFSPVHESEAESLKRELLREKEKQVRKFIDEVEVKIGFQQG